MKNLFLIALAGWFVWLCFGGCSPNMLKYGHVRHELDLVTQNDSIAVFACIKNCPYRDTFYFKGWKNPKP